MGASHKIAVFGSSGGTGRQIIAQALDAGYDVTAFVRNPSAIEGQRPRLKIVAGDIDDSMAVASAIDGCDAVLCSLGGSPLRRQERVCSTAMKHIVRAMQEAKVRRIIAISTFGAGDTRPLVGWFARTVLFGAVLRSEVADKEAMEAQLSASSLDWTVVRIGLLGNNPARGAWRAVDDGSVRGMGKISRADVAAFMLAQIDSPMWVRRRPVLMD
jgi:putative NADH-flavin reductase